MCCYKYVLLQICVVRTGYVLSYKDMCCDKQCLGI